MLDIPSPGGFTPKDDNGCTPAGPLGEYKEDVIDPENLAGFGDATPKSTIRN